MKFKAERVKPSFDSCRYYPFYLCDLHVHMTIHQTAAAEVNGGPFQVILRISIHSAVTHGAVDH